MPVLGGTAPVGRAAGAHQEGTRARLHANRGERVRRAGMAGSSIRIRGFTDPEYGGVGLTEAEARERYPRAVGATGRYTELDRAVIDDRREGLCKLIVEPTSRRVLGAHVVGEGATEVVQIVATAMAGG